MNVIHIHTDYKFIGKSEIFEDDSFANKIIIINSSAEQEKNCCIDHIRLKPTPQNINKIIEICNSFDLAFLYGLDKWKIDVVLGLDPGVKTAWRFFGQEIYGKHLENFLTSKTKKANRQSLLRSPGIYWQQKIKPATCNFLHVCKNLESTSQTKTRKFNQAINRIDFFLGLCREEYDYLKKLHPHLPKFINIPLRKEFKPIPESTFQLRNREKPPLVIVGNSKYTHNNHLDIIETIENCENKQDYNFSLLFSYGTENNYTKKIRREISGKGHFHLITEFMPIAEFDQLYKRASALIINSWRQSAAGSIFIAIKNGVKVYLHPDNPLYTWLTGAGLLLFELNQLAGDLESGRIKLKKEQSDYNIKCLQQIQQKNSIKKFQDRLLCQISSPI